MLIEHLGETVDVDSLRAAVENSVIKALRKHGPLRQRDLWYRSAGQRVGREQFQSLIDSLVERRLIVRQSTNRVNAFILRVAPDKRRRERADKKRAETLKDAQPQTQGSAA